MENRKGRIYKKTIMHGVEHEEFKSGRYIQYHLENHLQSDQIWIAKFSRPIYLFYYQFLWPRNIPQIKGAIGGHWLQMGRNYGVVITDKKKII